MPITIRTSYIIPKIFLYCLGILPAASLLWQQHIYFFKLNWILYPFVVLAILFSISLRSKAPSIFYMFLGVFILFSVYLGAQPTDWESVFRIFMTLLPLTFLGVIDEKDHNNYRIFWTLFLITISLPLVLSYLQYTGRVPYYEFDYVNGESVGRISGGYNKPNNFIAFLFPLFLFGFYRWKIQNKTFQGLFLIVVVVCIVYLTGLRTAVVIFTSIFICSFAPITTGTVIYWYYKYYLNFLIGIFVLWVIYLSFTNFGFYDAIRGRVPMWQAHSDAFFNSPWFEMLFGKGRVLLDEKYSANRIIASLSEVHNNTFRTLITFGLVGYFLYCSFIRWMVLHVYNQSQNATLKYIRLSSFMFLLMYSITNEPAYYSSVLWSILTALWPVWQKETEPALA